MKNITIYPTAAIREAMEALGKSGEKILLVVDDNYTLIGSLTDGDIRRYILKEQDLAGTIENIYNKNPIFVFQNDYNLANIKRIFLNNKIDVLPIVDNGRKLVDYLTWEKIFGSEKRNEDKKLNIPTVIMAGGAGTRLEPFTKVLPKPLIPVDGKPVIDYIIDKFSAYGISKFYLTLNYMSKVLRAYFEEKNSNYKIEVVEENEPRGTAGSLKLLSDKLDRPFFVSNCDIVIEADYADLYQFHVKNKFDITLVASAKEFHIPYGICELNVNGNLEKIKEKPKYNFLVNTGLYVLNPDIIKFIPDTGLFHITHLIDRIRETEGTVGVYPVSENAWIDVGQWAEYRKALKVIEGI